MLSTPAQLVAPVVVARGTLSITTTEIYFEVDEEDPTFKNTDAKVRADCLFTSYHSLQGKIDSDHVLYEIIASASVLLIQIDGDKFVYNTLS